MDRDTEDYIFFIIVLCIILIALSSCCTHTPKFNEEEFIMYEPINEENVRFQTINKELLK